MSEPDSGSAHRYKIRRSTGKVEFVDRNKLARLQMARAERYRRASQRRRLLALLAGVFVVAVAVLAVIWVWPAGGGDSLLVAGPGAELLPPRPPLRQVEEVPVEGPAARAPSSAPEDVVAAAVRSWARAWSEQDVLGYLAHYSQSFVPADGSERSDWARERRIRVVLPEAVAVELSDLEVELLDGGRARAALHRVRADAEAAEADLAEALEIAERSSMPLFECDAHLEWARLDADRGDTAAARGHLETAKAIVERTGYRRRDPEVAVLERVLGERGG